jgi:hypothetical protein
MSTVEELMALWNNEKKQAADDVSRRQRLAELTATAKRGLVAFADTGTALAAIQAEELWRLEAATWDAWCSKSLGLTERRVSQLIEAAKTCQTLKASGLSLPTSERVARELAGLEPEKQVEVWQEATAEAGDGEPTTELVAKAARKRRTRKAGQAKMARPVSLKVPGAAVRIIPRKRGWTGLVAALEHALELARRQADEGRREAA